MLDNTMAIVQTAGGIGLFLLGMIILTSGLRELPGNALRSALMRFTKSPLSGAVTGAVITAILQSSSATTVAAVGFVSAGLMSFSHALGIIFGANIGTTITGWLVALLGIKLQFGTVVLPVILFGAILKLFARGRLGIIGYSLAGFGLIFVGISMLQQGMSDFDGFINSQIFQTETLAGILKLVLIGIMVTVITQSSSAGVAATLTALYSGAISFEQAAILVIGMDIGTTFKAIVATIGGSTAARRTGYSHVIYNLFTGSMALFLVAPYIYVCNSVAPTLITDNAEIALVLFHTSFNTLGVIIVLPFAYRFARMMTRLVPDIAPFQTSRLDDALLEHPDLALNAIHETTRNQLLVLLDHITAILTNGRNGKRVNLVQLQTALDETHIYLDNIHLSDAQGREWERLITFIHILDHMQRLHERCEEEEDRAITAGRDVELLADRTLLINTINEIIDNIKQDKWSEAASHAGQTRTKIQESQTPYREAVMQKIARGQMDVAVGTEHLEAIRWLNRISRHIGRITEHFKTSVLSVGK